MKALAFRVACDLSVGAVALVVALQTDASFGLVAWSFAFAYVAGIQLGERWEQYKRKALEEEAS